MDWFATIAIRYYCRQTQGNIKNTRTTKRQHERASFRLTIRIMKADAQSMRTDCQDATIPKTLGMNGALLSGRYGFRRATTTFDAICADSQFTEGRWIPHP